MPWQQITLTTNSDQSDMIADLLHENGALSVTFTDAKDEPLFQLQPEETPLWTHTEIKALFEMQDNISSIMQVISQEMLPHTFSYNSERLEDQDWVRKTQQNFPAKQFANKLWVIPSWNDEKEHAGTIVKVDPGLAFGTGTHATTALCLEWLAKNPPLNESVIDYGCGSGILSLAALALGAEKVYAIDHDPQALEATQNNADLNAFPADALEILTCQQAPNIQVPLVIANILANPLLELKTTLQALTNSDATLVLSGILAAAADRIVSAYSDAFDLIEKVQQEEWVRLVFKRSP
jgi:ribosomal protein L11 methyltransferase